MKLTNHDKAEVLLQALPYITKYAGETIVIKYGGSAMTDESLKKSVAMDIALLQSTGVRTVVVHGGGPEISETLKSMGIPTKFSGGLRVTDAATMKVVQMVLAGKINKDLVALLGGAGAEAVGLSGVDGGMIKAKPLGKDMGFVGDVESVNVKPVTDLLNAGYIPVIAPVGIGEGGEVYNINADTAAARVAGAMKAKSFLNMTDEPGILEDPSDPASLIRSVSASEAKELISDGIVTGGMLPKVNCCIDAIRRGVDKVFIIDGREPHSLLIEMLSDEGIGTMFY